MAINFAVTRVEHDLIHQIVTRTLKEHPGYFDPLTLHMDLTAAHMNGCRLDLSALFAAEAFEFAHDIAGITRHIDRETGELGDCFVPRFAQRA
ncbi:MAG TPA: hypothetical protein DDX89_02280 [Candidatus Omnitrophica bacterium]|nr:hypothetical protein [Candidatus Omnitrophota bacterium]HBH96605.1 hypothetical protein [Candidatus Omnitrophota bacterium]